MRKANEEILQKMLMEEMLRAVDNEIIDGKIMTILYMHLLKQNNAYAIRSDIPGIEGADIAIIPVPGNLAEDVLEYVDERLKESEGGECKDGNVH